VAATGGLSSPEAQARLDRYGLNVVHQCRPLTRLRLLVGQLKSPLLLILVFAATASAVTAAWTDAANVLVIVCTSVAIGYVREYRADETLQPLSAVRTHRPLFRSRPGAILLWSTVLLIPLTLAMPYLPFAGLLGFVPLPGTLVVTGCAIAAGYAIAVELAKPRQLASKAIA
jgi:hypothetical protein